MVIEHSGNELLFTLDNGPGNQVTGAMMDAMMAALAAEHAAPRARVLRLRARGPAFCTGRERAGRDVESLRREAQRIIEYKRALRATNLISIAEVQGDAAGFGFGLAILCDFSLIAETASLSFPEMKHGLPPAAIMAYLGDFALPRHAFPLVLFGDPITPRRALEIGLISQVAAPADLKRDADALAARILALKPAAVRRCKEFFQIVQQNTFDQNCRLAVEALTVGSLATLAGGNDHGHGERGGTPR
ncbi:MAG TPA: enoyl-CoA hydratase-related protein [Alphaproteobacteria bacterium]